MQLAFSEASRPAVAFKSAASPLRTLGRSEMQSLSFSRLAQHFHEHSQRAQPKQASRFLPLTSREVWRESKGQSKEACLQLSLVVGSHIAGALLDAAHRLEVCGCVEAVPAPLQQIHQPRRDVPPSNVQPPASQQEGSRSHSTPLLPCFWSE